MTTPSTIESEEGVAHHRQLPPLEPGSRDPYSGEPVDAERLTQHLADDTCRWVARHKVSDCGYPKHPGWAWVGHRWVEKRGPVTAAELTEMPRALAQPEERAPWE